MYIDVEDERIVQALLACIAEHGITRLTVDHVARKLGSSRSGLYRQFGSWPEVVVFGYGCMLEWLDARSPRLDANRRVELERWWAEVIELLSSVAGENLLAMRALAALQVGWHPLNELELERLRGLGRWTGMPLVTRTVWGLVLVAAAPKLDGRQREELRELVWGLVNREDASRDADDDIDMSVAEALHELT